MMSEMNQVQRYFGARFGRANPIKDGVYAVPTETSKGSAFMKMEIINGNPAGEKNFHLFWDENLTVDWYSQPKPTVVDKESRFAKAFRRLEKANQFWND